MIITSHNIHFMTLLKEIVCPSAPLVSHDEAVLLLESHNGIGFVGSSTELADLPERIANTVWSHLLETDWKSDGRTLQERIDEYPSRDAWDSEITEDSRFRFVERLHTLPPLEGVALHIAIYEWWNEWRSAGIHARDSHAAHLALRRLFNIKG